MCSRDLLDVVAVVSNPAAFNTRYRLFNEFVGRMRATPGVRLTTVELQQGCRPFRTDATVKLRTTHELWHKENMINVAVQNLPDDWKYVAWIDADITFVSPRWVQDTIDQLQTYDVVQLFSHAIDLCPKMGVMQVHKGFGYMYQRGETWKQPGYGAYWHPGYAWAATRRAFNAMGGLIDFAILGSADFHMAMSLVGMADKTINHGLHDNYKKLVKIFEARCEKHIRRNIGHVPGSIYHEFHGSKRNRFYRERWKILVETKFDPLEDIKRDDQGLWQLESSKFALRDQLRNYFRSRNEDSVDWDE